MQTGGILSVGFEFSWMIQFYCQFSRHLSTEKRRIIGENKRAMTVQTAAILSDTIRTGDSRKVCGSKPGGLLGWEECETGEVVSSGTYFYQLLAGDYTETRKMVILK